MLQEMFAEPDARQQLRLFLAAHCALFTHGADVLRAALQAIDAPEVAALSQRGDGHRRVTAK